MQSVTAVAEQMGALVVALPLGGREVDATSLHPPGEPPLFVVNSDAPADRQRFTLGHELGHVACKPGDGSDPEEMAQQFSGELLAPARELYQDLKAADITPARLLELKRKWLISAAALLYRAHDLAVITGVAVPQDQRADLRARLADQRARPAARRAPGRRAGTGTAGHHGGRQHRGRGGRRRDHHHHHPRARRIWQRLKPGQGKPSD